MSAPVFVRYDLDALDSEKATYVRDTADDGGVLLVEISRNDADANGIWLQSVWVALSEEAPSTTAMFPTQGADTA